MKKYISVVTFALFSPVSLLSTSFTFNDDTVLALDQRDADTSWHFVREMLENPHLESHKLYSYLNAIKAQYGSLECVVNNDGETLLHLSAQYGNTELLEYLAQQEPDLINQCDNYGNNAAHVATRYVSDNPAAIKELIDCLRKIGIRLNQQNNMGETPLHHAVLRAGQASGAFPGGIEFLHSLLEYVRCSLKSDNNGKTPLHWAIDIDAFTAIKIFGEHQLLNTDDTSSNTLYYALKSKKEKIVSLLVNLGATLDSFLYFSLKGDEAVEDIKKNIAFLAAKEGDIAMLDLLFDNHPIFEIPLKSSVSIGKDCSNSDGETLLHAAVNSNQLAVVEYLCNKGLDLNRLDNYGFAPLHRAIMKNHAAALEILLANQADLLTLEGYKTPLMLALFSNSIESVEVLLSVPAVQEELKFNPALAEIPVANNNCAMLRVLVDNGITLSSDLLWQAVVSNRPIIAEYLIKMDVPCDIRDEYDNTLLHKALYNGSTEMVRILVERGCNPNLMNCHGEIPLHIASLHDQSGIFAALLLAAGADPDVLDEAGNPPLYYAVAQGNLEAVLTLLNYGADASYIDDNKCNLLHIAVSNNHYEMAYMILERSLCSLEDKNGEGLTALDIARQARNERLYNLLSNYC